MTPDAPPRPKRQKDIISGLRIAPMVIIKRGATTMIEKQMTAAMIAMLGLLAFVSNAVAEQKFQKLTGSQIRAKFAGMELTDEAHWGEVFEPTGRLTITSMGHKRIGKWLVHNNELCLETGKEPGGGCYQVWVSGKNVELRNQLSNVPLEAVLQKPADGK
jgi:hypothetical protein